MSDGISEHRTKWFSNDNLEVQVDDVRGCNAVVIHTQALPVPTNFVELLALLQAMRDAHVEDIFLIFPYMPFSRSDRKNKPRISTLGQLFPEILCEVLGVRHVLLCDPHDSHLKHYFKPVADEISSVYLFANDFNEGILTEHKREECGIIFADATALKRYEKLAHLTGLATGFIDKDRPDDSENPHIKRLVGDVRDKLILLVDDEILTGGTSLKDTDLILNEKAHAVIACAFHPILEDRKLYEELGGRVQGMPALMRRFEDSKISQFVIGNTIPIQEKLPFTKKFRVIRVEKFIAEAIARLLFGQSLTELHRPESVNLYRI
ncbi:MAG: Ribose-phosphate pyrophosphokinase [Parcubacteria group bacterium GW2011_GWA2_51_10]|nr:MAG: Ribose-phosphate pyrophosphokinase [Parcubacteria group bacterium GW2011_GWA2_51_10]